VSTGAVTAANLDPYIKGGTSNATACPAGGTVTLGNLGVNPSCTVAGHVLQ
jgi:hypothetical protein